MFGRLVIGNLFAWRDSNSVAAPDQADPVRDNEVHFPNLSGSTRLSLV